MVRLNLALFMALFSASSATQAADGNRLAYLDDNSPYYPHLKFPRLITPQWIGEEGVDAVVIFAIDDMREVQKYETYLRPILERLKKIDGRAPVSIMTCSIDPKNEHLQKWLKEGLSLETHTADHPCPMFRKGDLAATRATYEKCVDQLSEVPGSKPVAFRTPCCDSLNTVSPKLFDAIFNQKTAKGKFLQIDSSVFTWFTPNDPDLPRDLVYDKDGKMRFAKYLPADRTFVNIIEDYPYPYVINRLCWEFPCMTPSDWQAQHLHKPNNPKTVEDWKAALDCTVIKQGVFSVVFHPHGWIKPEQVIDFIDYAQTKYGKRVKFLNFREALERLNKNLLAGQPLRDPKTGEDSGIRLMDWYESGYLNRLTGWGVKSDRIWRPQDRKWEKWGADLPANTPRMTEPAFAIKVQEGDYLWISRDSVSKIFIHKQNEKLPFSLPPDARLPAKFYEDSGLRFVDLDGDDKLDVVFSDENGYGVYLFESMDKGWSRKIIAVKRGDKDKNELPPIAIKGVNNGAWIANKHIWWANENTDLLKDVIDRRSFADLIGKQEPKARSPEESLKMLKPRPGFVVEQVASEPLVEDPIGFAFGPDGKLWVVEMGDYPLGVDGQGKFGGKVRLLESTKGDGKYDKSTVFLDSLGFPTSVLPWRKGVLITCAPDILYAEDTDGDGKADVKKVLFTGFTKGNQQHRVNSLVWGLDNWIHCANGDSGGTITSPQRPQGVDIRGRDFRIRPDTGEIELEAGQSQFGRCRDDWDNWFGGNNSNPMWHVALNDRYLKRNPHIISPPPTIPVSVTPGPAVVYPISRTSERFNDFAMANRFTSACSPIIYRDDLFGTHFAGSLFVSEPVHNLVHREVMTVEGTTFKSRRGTDEERSEFLASEDNWFRPTMLATGPDGALWVADMYRHVIEHPEWIPKDWQKKLDLRAGHDKGRIYRVFPADAKPRAVQRLDKMSIEELVAALDSPNGWQRDMAQQLLIWKNDNTAKPLLAALYSKSKNPLTRLHALCTLDGLGTIHPKLLLEAYGDPHSGVVRHAVRLSEERFIVGMEKKLAELTKHPDAQVRMQVAYSLAAIGLPEGGTLLAELAKAGAADRYLVAAALSSLNETNLPGFVQAIFGSSDGPPPAPLVDALFAFAVAKKDNKVLGSLIGAATPKDGAFAPWQLDALGSFLESLRRRNLSLSNLRNEADTELKQLIDRLTPAFIEARKKVQDPKAKPAEAIQAIRLLGRGPDGLGDDLKLLAQMLSPQYTGDMQSAALTALGRFNDQSVPTMLLAGWKGYTPAIRAEALSILIARLDWIAPLFDTIEKKQILAADIDASSRQRLLTHQDAKIRARAEKLLAGAIDVDRQKVIDTYKSSLTKMGDRERGKQVFTKSCSACHKIGDVGQGLAPDLTALGDKTPDYLLMNILDPNRAVEARYLSYTATLKDGTQRVGFLHAETATSFTLVGTDGKPQSVLRGDIDELRSSGKSVMPEGIEKDISIELMADLLAFLRSSQPQLKRKEFPGNLPQVLQPNPDGSVRLPAVACEIYGTSLVFESKLNNLGFWGSENDHAVWTINLPKGGKFDVTLDYACAVDAAGNSFVMQAGGSRLIGRVESTGSWETYKSIKTGSVNLNAGEQRLVFRSNGPLKGYLLDLRGLRLTPGKE